MAANVSCFHNYRNKLFNGKPILRFGAALFVFIFALLSSCLFVCVYPFSSLGRRCGMNGNSGSCRQPN